MKNVRGQSGCEKKELNFDMAVKEAVGKIHKNIKFIAKDIEGHKREVV